MDRASRPTPPLFDALDSGDMAAFKELLPPADVNAPGQEGASPLMSAARWGYLEAASMLLACQGIDVNARAEDGSTALMLAADAGGMEMLSLLMASPRIDLRAKDRLGCDAARRAALAGHEGAAKAVKSRAAAAGKSSGAP
jgi:ankyrin repeat protein